MTNSSGEQQTIAGSKRAFSIKSFCNTYEFGKDGVYDAIRRGDLIARKYGKRTIITAEDAARFIAALPRLELPAAERERGADDHGPAKPHSGDAGRAALIK